MANAQEGRGQQEKHKNGGLHVVIKEPEYAFGIDTWSPRFAIPTRKNYCVAIVESDGNCRWQLARTVAYATGDITGNEEWAEPHVLWRTDLVPSQ